MATVLYNGLGRYDEAREAARLTAGDPSGIYISTWALPELIEAAARSGHVPMAGDAAARLSDTTQAGGTDWGLGIEARSRALLTEGQAADDLYREAIDRLGRSRPVRGDRDGSLCRTGPKGAAGHRGNRPQAHRLGRR